MKPDQFRNLRESRKQTREALGAILGVTASAIVQWERGTRAIPQWAIEKMFRSVDVALPIEDLALLMDTATRAEKDFSEYLSEIIRQHLAGKRGAEITAMETNGTYDTPEKHPAASPASDVSRVAEDTDAPGK